jgi:hypothetical protein
MNEDDEILEALTTEIQKHLKGLTIVRDNPYNGQNNPVSDTTWQPITSNPNCPSKSLTIAESGIPNEFHCSHCYEEISKEIGINAKECPKCHHILNKISYWHIASFAMHEGVMNLLYLNKSGVQYLTIELSTPGLQGLKDACETLNKAYQDMKEAGFKKSGTGTNIAVAMAGITNPNVRRLLAEQRKRQLLENE